MNKHKNITDRIIFAAMIVLLCVSALYARKVSGYAPNFYNIYFPDTAWTMAVYCGFGLLFNKGAKVNFSASLIFSYLIEISQLFSPQFLVAARSTVIGGLIFGYGFLWSDIICYTVGALICFCVETVFRRIKKS